MKTTLKLAAGALLSLAAAASQAQNYAGALVQMSHYNLGASSCDEQAQSLGFTGSVECKERATGVKLYVGTAVSESGAIEAAYVDFGRAKQSIGDATASVRVSAFVVAAVLRAEPMPKLLLSGKVGIAAAKALTKIDVAGVQVRDDSQHPSLYLGLGVEYPVYKDVKLVGAYDFTRVESLGEKFGVSAFGLGAQIGF